MLTRRTTPAVAPLDALLLRGDRDPSTRAIMCAALVLEHEPSWAELVAAFSRASQAVPRMRERVAPPLVSWGPAQWVPDQHFDVTHHLRRVGAPGRGGLDEVWELAGSASTAPFDPARPLWDAVLVTGLDDASAVVLLRLHHAIADGVRVIVMMAHLLDLEPEPVRDALPVLAQRGSTLARVSARMVGTASHTARSQRRSAMALTSAAVRTSLDPWGSTVRATSWARSAARSFRSGGTTPSPLLRERSRSRRFKTLELPLAELKACATRHGATVNDVFLTGLVGGVAGYHERLGSPVDDFALAFPIDVSGPDAPEAGNHFSAAVLAAPASLADPGERLRSVHELVASRRAEPGLDAPARVAPLLEQAPTWLATAGLAAYARRVDVQASNIAGPDCALYLGGASVRRIFGFGPLPGIPLMAVLVSYDGLCTVGLTIDPAAVTDVETLVDETRAAFAALLATGRPDDAED